VELLEDLVDNRNQIIKLFKKISSQLTCNNYQISKLQVIAI
jgi:hypothetical protein